MKKESKYLLLLGIAALIYMATKLFGPRDFDWTVTLNKDDKNPFGAYVLNDLMPGIFPGQDINHSYETAYELYDSVKVPVNFLSLSIYFSPGEEDTKALLENIANGGNAYIAADYFYGDFADTLELRTSDYYFHTSYSTYNNKGDTASIIFKNHHLLNNKTFLYPRNNIHHYFQRFDSTKTTVLATNDLDYPVTIHIKWGKGNLYLNSTPLTFSNAYLLAKDNPEFVSRSLSLLPNQDLIWTEFYQNGRMEAHTPLRFILTNTSLRWAYFLSAFSLLIFIAFEIKRKQRIIPVIKPLANTSLEFVATIANLYYQTANHKDIANKKIAFFMEHLRTRFWLNTHKITPDFISTLARKSGHEREEVKKLFIFLENIQAMPSISADDLLEVNKAIENFEKTIK